MLRVRDHGPGLPAGLKGREQTLFDKFTRGQAESATPGVGLGLAICKAVVDAHGGEISAANAADGGAEFTVTLPRRRRPSRRRSRPESMPTPVAIVIEDEPQIRRFVRGALEAEGWQVHEAGTLRDGLAAAGTRQPDLLVLDLGLPDGDGITLIRDVRGWSGVPIIVLSARSDEADKIAALDAGADDYLTKPFGIGELLARVRANLRRPRGARRTAQATRPRRCSASARSRSTAAPGWCGAAGAEVHLTPTEYRLLSVLVANAGRVLTQRQLLREVWGPSHARAEPLPAHLHGPPAAEAGSRSRAAAASADRDGGGLSAGG